MCQKDEAQFGKPHSSYFHRIGLLRSKKIILSYRKWRRKISNYEKSDFVREKIHTGGILILRLVDFSWYPTAVPSPLSYVAHLMKPILHFSSYILCICVQRVETSVVIQHFFQMFFSSSFFKHITTYWVWKIQYKKHGL